MPAAVHQLPHQAEGAHALHYHHQPSASVFYMPSGQWRGPCLLPPAAALQRTGVLWPSPGSPPPEGARQPAEREAAPAPGVPAVSYLGPRCLEAAGEAIRKLGLRKGLVVTVRRGRGSQALGCCLAQRCVGEFVTTASFPSMRAACTPAAALPRSRLPFSPPRPYPHM